MKKSYIVLIAMTIFMAACIKKDYTTNNATTVIGSQPEFLVNGLSSVTLVNNSVTYTQLDITVAYADSAQENVSLALTGLPDGIVMDTTWVKGGIPTFITSITLFDTLATGATPGTYPLTLTAITASGKQKQYTFNLYVQPMPTTFLGKYTNCTSPCATTSPFTDSLYADPTVINKVWFSNFNNTGTSVYALIGINGKVTIPAQVAGGKTYKTLSSGTIYLTTHQFSIPLNVDSTGTCYISYR